MRPKEQRSGLAPLLVVWVGIAAAGACQAIGGDGEVVETAELGPLAECPTALCPEPVCPEPVGPQLPGVAVAPPTPSPQKPEPGADETESRVDLNNASYEELTGLPGIGPKTAQAIMRRRRKRPFGRARQLRTIGGIGPRKWRRLKERVTVTPPQTP